VLPRFPELCTRTHIDQYGCRRASVESRDAYGSLTKRSVSLIIRLGSDMAERGAGFVVGREGGMSKDVVNVRVPAVLVEAKLDDAYFLVSVGCH